MSYIRKSLSADERILHQGAIHWIIYVKPFLWLLAGMFLLSYATTAPYNLPLLILFGSSILLLIGIIQLVGAIVEQVTTDLAVTNKKVVAKWGLLSRRTIEQRLGKVDSVEVVQTLVGRVLNYGTVIIHGSGVSLTPITRVWAPLSFRRHVEAAIELTSSREVV